MYGLCGQCAVLLPDCWSDSQRMFLKCEFMDITCESVCSVSSICSKKNGKVVDDITWLRYIGVKNGYEFRCNNNIFHSYSKMLVLKGN